MWHYYPSLILSYRSLGLPEDGRVDNILECCQMQHYHPFHIVFYFPASPSVWLEDREIGRSMGCRLKGLITVLVDIMVETTRQFTGAALHSHKQGDIRMCISQNGRHHQGSYLPLFRFREEVYRAIKALKSITLVENEAFH